MKNLVSFLKTRKGLLVLALIAVAAAAYYYTTQVKNSKVESTPAGPTSEAVEAAPTVPSLEATDKAVLPTIIEYKSSGSTDDPSNGSTDSPADPVDGEEIHPVNPEDDEVNPTSKFDDPTSYYEPTITGVDRAVWAAANRAAPRCENFRHQARAALLVRIN